MGIECIFRNRPLALCAPRTHTPQSSDAAPSVAAQVEGMDDRILNLRVHDATAIPALHGICIGYERGEWRSGQLVEHLIDSLPEFALTHSEREALGYRNAVPLLRKAARTIYNTQNTGRRGELGELLLHVVLTEFKKTVPAISKIYFKDSPNDTVKGFDAVHVVHADDGLELWLGEVKFYTTIGEAIKDVVEELHAHTSTLFLRTEFFAIINKLDRAWPHAEKLQALLDPNTSLDDVFQRLRIPVLLTYDSKVIKSHSRVSDAYRDEFAREIRKHHGTFKQKGLPPDITIELFLFPVREKAQLLEEFDQRLRALQNI